MLSNKRGIEKKLYHMEYLSITVFSFADINECEENLHDCDQQNPVCVNTDGSFVCRAVQCPYGYRMNITLKACQGK